MLCIYQQFKTLETCSLLSYVPSRLNTTASHTERNPPSWTMWVQELLEFNVFQSPTLGCLWEAWVLLLVFCFRGNRFKGNYQPRFRVKNVFKYYGMKFWNVFVDRLLNTRPNLRSADQCSRSVPLKHQCGLLVEIFESPPRRWEHIVT